MTVTLRCTDLAKRYPGQERYALGSPEGGVSFDVERGELFALVGPSGCGKTTTLRIIGGFVDASAGVVEIDGRSMGRMPPYKRPTNTVFQSYSLFPHLSVGANVGFGLGLRRVRGAERARRVADALELVGLGGQERRRVTQLSGGQQQRAALARALVLEPQVLLLDEPFGALDLKLRKEMRDELFRLKQSTGTTFVHVTHDQEEACAIADRIAVMDAGQIVQLASPFELFQKPNSSYVASFIDAGTLIRGKHRRQGEVIEIVADDLTVRAPMPATNRDAGAMAAVIRPHLVEIRPTTLDPGSAEPNTVVGVIARSVFMGEVFEVQVKISDALAIRAAVPANEVSELTEFAIPGTRVQVSWPAEGVVVVPDSSERTLANLDPPAPAVGIDPAASPPGAHAG